jgi:hypothetical protein
MEIEKTLKYFKKTILLLILDKDHTVFNLNIKNLILLNMNNQKNSISQIIE